MNKKKKLIRITTVPISLKILLKDQLRFINKYFEVIGISSEGKDLLEVKENEEIKIISLNMSRKITPIRDFISLIKMIMVFLKEKPDIVHTHTPKAGIIGMMAAFICKIPHRLHTVAGLPVMEAVGKKKKLLLLVEKLTYFCATDIYPNSKGLEDYILENKLTKKEKMKIIGHGSSNGIDTNYFQRTDDVIEKASELKIKFDLENKFVFSFVGRIVKDKGIDELLYAFNRLSKQYENIKLLLIGKFEDDLDPISNESKGILDKNDFIINVGFQNDIRSYLSASDCFVLPTYREGFPNVVLQACCMELPCIVTNINGCNEIIQNNENGIIVEPKNKEELYYAMKNFLDDNTLAKTLLSNTRLNMIEKYDRQQFFKYLLDEYNRILNK